MRVLRAAEEPVAEIEPVLYEANRGVEWWKKIDL